jgi:hypothetical protein
MSITNDVDLPELPFCVAVFRPLPGNVPPAITQPMLGHYQRLGFNEPGSQHAIDASSGRNEADLFRGRLRGRLRDPS